MSREQIKAWLLKCAEQQAARGLAFAQQGVVLRAAKAELQLGSIAAEQTVLDCWHELFREGRLGWGYSLDHSDSPFFHVPAQVSA